MKALDPDYVEVVKKKVGGYIKKKDRIEN